MTDNNTTGILRRLAALERQVAAIVRIGRVAQVRTSPDHRVRVNVDAESAPVLTGWVPVAQVRAGAAVMHSPLSVGETVLLVSPGGVADVSFAVASLPNSSHATETAEDQGGTVYFGADVSIDGDVSIYGDLSATGDVDAGGDVSAGGDVIAGTGTRVRLLTHVHNPPIGGPPQRM